MIYVLFGVKIEKTYNSTLLVCELNATIMIFFVSITSTFLTASKYGSLIMPYKFEISKSFSSHL